MEIALKRFLVYLDTERGASSHTLRNYGSEIAEFMVFAQARGIDYAEQTLTYLLQEYYVKPDRELRACHPRDILDHLTDIARFHGIPPQMTKELINQACEGYFVDL